MLKRWLGYCMQDVCISFWKEDGSSDMMLKVTDICSTDPSDPTHCESPVDIKVDRTKMKIMQGLTDQDSISAYPQLSGDEFPEKIWWFFTKCWADVWNHSSLFSPQPRFSLQVYSELTTLCRVFRSLLTKATTGSPLQNSPTT